MRRAAALAAAVVLAIGIAGMRGAEATTATWKGTITGKGPVTFGTGGCTYFEQQLVHTKLNRPGVPLAHISMDGCVDESGATFRYNGTFTITTALGKKITGTVSGVFSSPASPVPFTGTFTITGGTGEYAHATGSLSASGTFTTITPPAPNGSARANLTFSGSVSS
jgi:hypothetical protein